MKIVTNFIPPTESTPFNPAKTVDIPAGGSSQILMNGMGGESFGVRRILPYAPNMDSILVSARLNEDLYLFRDLQLSVVHQLFKGTQGLLAPFIIQKSNSLVFELENIGPAKQPVNIQVIGYDHYGLSKLQAIYSEIGAPMPQPRFLYGYIVLPSGAVNMDMGVKAKSIDVQARRLAMSSDRPGDITASLKVYNTTIRNEVFLEQINDEFGQFYANVPFIVGSNVPFQVYTSNNGPSQAHVSFLCEAYVSGQTESNNPLKV
ncbi:hypothetical protein [Fodinibius sp. AD559]|uniref:hypothetical protein n=1 Tax=Fodinibius sp. AD559 TaxID=3424179 RepID=UPI004046EA01